MKKRKWVRRVVAALLLGAILLFPWPLSEAAKEHAAAKAIGSLLNGSSVLHVPISIQPWRHLAPLPDATFFDHDSIYLENDTELELKAAFDRYRLKYFTDVEQKQVQQGANDWYEKHRVIVITNYDNYDDDGIEPGLRMNYYFGTLGAQAYRLRVHRCLIGTFVFYDYEWSS